MSNDLHRVLQLATQHNASDVHLQAGSVPMLRIAGGMRPVNMGELTDEDLVGFIGSIAPAKALENLVSSFVAGLDFSYASPELGRFRCSAFSHLGRPGVVLRVIKTKLPSIEELNLPQVVADVALSRRGLTLVTGTTGSGKSTTLAAMIKLINQSQQVKIIAVEDPIEYVHQSDKALISQLEVGTDTPSFAQALRQALRQNPDVILIGELRDVESLRMALQAADTGHQVFSTIHSATASQTIDRIISMFPPAEHKLLLSQLAASLEAIISQRLLTTVDEKLRPAIEVLRGNGVTEKMIVENRLPDLLEYMEKGESGMQSFDQHILRLHQEELISGTEALRWATRPESLAMAMRGIRGSTFRGAGA